ncbi:hypothetical protein PTSG_01140 [Salpingoeca rosetta]|uniref:ER membrane protein complex subunit 3 n=1 Tax=Salpingoeca rosetta (strain ATCC 50818 / BSB-021) TaxID=946362 RepID=F2U0X5_SALR5|nr:uncharacterized protein PTSG_01140 [Salpingoeca rosetta]EGD80549.1 hypothetical protein PTSG_01140 [Salpingoeca rosetta]|eukprot:XP_004997110.1 hypothetical protein PTSG_01140 [Salpingoeca rosetta]
MLDLLLDPAIRAWVVIPIFIITFCVGLCRHYVSQLIASTPQLDRDVLMRTQLLQRARLLRANGRFLPAAAFNARKQYFISEKNGVLTKKKEEHKDDAPVNPMQDPSMMMNMVKGQAINYVPMVVVMSLISWAFSGFVIIKVPFPLTIAFKPMLQRGIALSTLSASWVSSMSFYLTCVFGLRGLYSLVLGSANYVDETSAMLQQQQAMARQPQQPGKLYQAEYDALQVSSHDWALNPRSEDDDDGMGFKDDLALVEKNLLASWQ